MTRLLCAILALTACGGSVDPMPTPSSVDASGGDVVTSDVVEKPDTMADSGNPDASGYQDASSCDPCDTDAGGNPSLWYCTAAHQWSICDPNTPTSASGCLLHYTCDAGTDAY